MIDREQWNRELLTAITTAQAQLAGEIQAIPLFEQLLEALLNLTASDYGFIGEIRHTATGTPYLRTRAITNIIWKEAGQRFYEERAPDWLEFTKLETLYGAVITSQVHVIANSPATDPRRGGLPDGHPRLDAFLGLPLHSGGALVGMMGIANRVGGYDEALVHKLEPFVQTCANAVFAVRADAERKSVEANLRYERSRLQVLLEGVLDAVISTDEAGRIDSINTAAERIFGYSQEELRGRSIALILGKEQRLRFRRFVDTYGVPDQQNTFGTIHELFGRRKSGEEFPMNATIVDVESGGRRYYSGIYRDVSETNRAKEQINSLRSELERRRFGNIVGRSRPMRRLYESIEEIAGGDWSVMVEGESGVGKELVARAIHAASPRKDGPFIVAHLTGHSDALIGSQLFGHRQGAFTGAVHDQQGLFEAGEGGTVFIDEIWGLSGSIQKTLVRAIEEREIVRMGDTTPRKLNVRVIGATHHSLSERVASGELRKDLHDRLRVSRIIVPALRERGDDIALLAETFLAEARATTGKALIRFSEDAIRSMLGYDWPGNVRELRSAVDYASIRCSGSMIQLIDLPPELDANLPHAAETPRAAPTPDQQRARIAEALKRTGGNRTDAARLLGISRATLYRRLDALGIRPS
jgi:PAS domain S-box-containing protein